MNRSVADELLAVVNERNEEIGRERRCVIHEQRLLHRAVHVLVFTGDGKLLIQQRSAEKDTFPLHWECVGGHLSPGESYEAAAAREVLEELGVEPHEIKHLLDIAACDITGFEFIEVYRATIREEPNPDATEVIAYEPVEPHRLIEMIHSGERPFSPAFVNTFALVHGRAAPGRFPED